METAEKWYVLYTKPRWEKKVATVLDSRGIKQYCPLNKVTKQWSDRKKVVLEPLFKGYIFVNISEEKKWDIKKIDGILNFVHWLGKPAVVKDEEIDTIKKFLHEFEDITVTDINALDVNGKVLVKQGLLMNHKGIILELIGNKARVKIEEMGIALTATFETKNLIKV